MGYSSTLLCLSTFTISLSVLALSSFTTADDAAVMSKLLAALSPSPSGWSASTDPCKWENVNCDGNNRVTSIDLVSKSLSGILPSNLGSLTQLTSLSLQGNSFSGPLPSLANLSSLQQLYLDNNNFSSIPDGFFQGLTSLEILTLSENTNLAPWPIPTELTQATSLVTLYASSANVIGSLPDIFDSFPSLKDLQLSFNNFTGPLPKSFGGSGIQILCLDNQKNGLSGTIDVLSSMTQLEQVWLHENQFTGPIPDLSKCTSLFDLQLRDNQFTGLVPDSLISLPSLKNISLANNQLQGPFPAFPSTVTLVTNNGTNSYCKATSGPCDSQVAILLGVAAALGYPIKLASSWKGNDACVSWSFIDCDSQKMITSVNFSKLGFVGTISPALANLTSLRTLDLNDNNLNGSIPDSLATLPDLQLLDVSNNNLTGPIPKFTSTVTFNAAGNPLLGKTTPSSGNGGGTSPRSNGTTPSGSPVGTAPGGTSVTPGMIAGIVTLSAGIGVVIVVICFRRKFSSNKITSFWKKKSPTHQAVQTILRNHRALAFRRYSYSDIKKITNFFRDKLGEGGYGSVYKGQLQDGCLVAVKVLKESRGEGEEFINEVVSIGKTSHINIVSLMGFCFEGSKRALIYEFMPNGSLEKFIYKENPSMVDHQLEWMTLYEIALGIARGLEYLHRGCNIRIVHFDIKPHNILLDENFCPKISDFGLAKICPREKSSISMLGVRGTAGYIAPEVYYRNFGGVSHKSDVYSYGMMIFEMVGGKRNIDIESTDRTSEIFFPHWIYKRLEQDEDLGLQGLIKENDQECAKKMIIVSMWCIQTDPSNRPPISRVVNMLEGSLEFLQVPSKPILSSPSRPPQDSSTIMESLQYDSTIP